MYICNAEINNYKLNTNTSKFSILCRYMQSRSHTKFPSMFVIKLFYILINKSNLIISNMSLNFLNKNMMVAWLNYEIIKIEGYCFNEIKTIPELHISVYQKIILKYVFNFSDF